jgi:hypothetical protein
LNSFSTDRSSPYAGVSFTLRHSPTTLLKVQPTASRAVVEAADREAGPLNDPDNGGEEELMKQLHPRPELLLQPR